MNADGVRSTALFLDFPWERLRADTLRAPVQTGQVGFVFVCHVQLRTFANNKMRAPSRQTRWRTHEAASLWRRARRGWAATGTSRSLPVRRQEFQCWECGRHMLMKGPLLATPEPQRSPQLGSQTRPDGLAPVGRISTGVCA